MHTLTASLVTSNPVRCPVCQQSLTGSGVWVVDSLAFCYDCSRLCTLPALGLEIDCALGCEFVTSYARVHGILLYNPSPTTSTNVTASRLHWEASRWPYRLTIDDLSVAGHREPDPAQQIVPQSRQNYTPAHRRTPTVRSTDSPPREPA